MRATLVSAAASAFVLLAAPAALVRVAAQPAAVVGSEEARATVETVSHGRRSSGMPSRAASLTMPVGSP